MKVIMMYRTALYAEKRKRFNLVTSFNNGTQVFDETNPFDAYSILTS